MPPLNQDAFTIDATGTVKIGENQAGGNQILITITNTGARQPKVRVTVNVKCGATPEALLDTKSAKVSASYANLTDNTTDSLSATSSSADSRSWQISSRGVAVDSGKKLTIKLSGFESNTPPGNAVVDVVVQIFKDNVWSPPADTVPEANRTLRVSKVAEQHAEPKIHYFTLNPDYVLHAGQTPIALNFYATGFDRLVLFRNNQEVENWPSNDHPKHVDGSIAGTFTDRPSISSTYRLEGKYWKPATPDTEERRTVYRAVQVISPGWNQIALPQGYPARLFVNMDFSGSDMARIYGLFIDGAGKTALYSSATGVDDWRPEPGEVPEYTDDDGIRRSLAMSPGVAYKGKLWLIGGSCVNPDSSSSVVWCYELDGQTPERRWRRKANFPPEMQPRAGHACVVVPRQNRDGKIVEDLWVFGGVNNGVELGDVWRMADEDGNKWVRIQPGGTIWPSRHMHAAVSFTPAPDRSTEVWMYGGNREDVFQTDLWSSSDGGKTWKRCMGIFPQPGAPLGATLVAYNVGEAATTQRLFLAGTFLDPAGPGETSNRSSSAIYEWQWRNQIWEARPVPDGWERFEGSPFYMQAIAYNSFLFVWSLHTAITASRLPKLNILI
jgi:hypothetical protein